MLVGCHRSKWALDWNRTEEKGDNCEQDNKVRKPIIRWSPRFSILLTTTLWFHDDLRKSSHYRNRKNAAEEWKRMKLNCRERQKLTVWLLWLGFIRCHLVIHLGGVSWFLSGPQFFLYLPKCSGICVIRQLLRVLKSSQVSSDCSYSLFVVCY